MKKQSNNLAALLSAKAARMTELQLDRFRVELAARLPQVVNEAAQAARQAEEPQAEAVT